LRVELQRQALALGLPVEFLGQQSQAAVAELLADSEVFVLPSVPAKSGDQDGLPVSLLEAAAAGCMPVASNLPGIDAVVIDGENGLLVNAGNPRQLAKALATALAQSGFRATAVGLMRLTIERYELSTVGASYNRILRQLLSEDRA
jgi:glycosyltransferase involved in cell wall biosynthesis